MGLFDRVERRLDSAVNGMFSRAFKAEVDPTEIAVQLQKQLDSGARPLDRDRRVVPNAFTVALSQHDYDRWAPYARTLNEQYIPYLRDYAAQRHYVFTGPITIAYSLDESLSTGRFTVASALQASTSGDVGTPPPPDGHHLVLEVAGVRHPLKPPGFTIGRGTEADLRINDPSVSRVHAEVTVEDAGDGQMRVEISDLGSTNGLVVNGQKVRSARLEDGFRVEIGNTRMLVHSPVGD